MKFVTQISACMMLLMTVADQAIGNEEDARKVLRAFIEKQYSNLPVAGEFLIKGLNSDRNIKPGDKVEKSTPATLELTPKTLRVRWAMDLNRERLEPLDKEHFSRHFLIHHDLSLEGHSLKSLNLTQSNRVTAIRPSSFGYLDGSFRPWRDYLNSNLKHLSLKHDQGIAIVKMKLTEQSPTYELNLDGETLQLRSVVGYSWPENEPFAKMDIIAYHKDTKTGKQFPKHAVKELRHPQSKNLRRRDELSMVSIHFPEKGPELDSWFDMKVPKNALITDKKLDRVSSPDSITSAKEVMERPGQFKELKRVDHISSLEASGDLVDEKDWLAWYWYAAIGFSVLTLIVVITMRLRKA